MEKLDVTQPYKIGDCFNFYKFYLEMFQYTIVPEWLSREYNLTWNEKGVLITIAKFGYSSGECFPSIEAISFEAGMNKRTVIRTIQSLSRKGFIVVETPTDIEKAKHRHNNYKFIWNELYAKIYEKLRGDKTAHREVTKCHLDIIDNDNRYIEDINTYSDKSEYVCMSYTRSAGAEREKNREKLLSDKAKPSFLAKAKKHPMPGTKSERPVSKEEQFSLERVPEQLRCFVELWERSCRKSRRDSKTFKQSLKDLQKLLSGRFFKDLPCYEKYNSYTLTFQDFKKSFEQFLLAKDNKAYYPNNKNYLQKMSLSEFFYNPRSQFEKSTFIKFLEHPAKLIQPKIECDEAHLEQLKIWYRKSVFCGCDIEIKDDTPFRLAAVKLVEFFKTHNQTYMMRSMTASDRARLLVSSLVNRMRRIADIKPWMLHSDLTFTNTFPAFLVEQGVLQNYKKDYAYAQHEREMKRYAATANAM